LLSEQLPPRPRLYRLRRAVIGAGLTLIGLALLGQTLLLLGGAPLPLLPLFMLFTASWACRCGSERASTHR
jgi:CHASE2 domain-containing sensor protein